jgi:hypothetical protein
MREMERIQGQPIPTNRPAYTPAVHCWPEFDFRFRPWRFLFGFLAVLRVNSAKITRLRHFLIHRNDGETLTVVSLAF